MNASRAVRKYKDRSEKMCGRGWFVHFTKQLPRQQESLRFIAVVGPAWQKHTGQVYLAVMRLFKPEGLHECLQNFRVGDLVGNKIIFCIRVGFPMLETSTRLDRAWGRDAQHQPSSGWRTDYTTSGSALIYSSVPVISFCSKSFSFLPPPLILSITD